MDSVTESTELVASSRTMSSPARRLRAQTRSTDLDHGQIGAAVGYNKVKTTVELPNELFRVHITCRGLDCGAVNVGATE